MPENEKQAEQWVSMGTRLSADRTRCSAWLDPGGQELLYASRVSYAIGSTYEVTVTRREAGAIIMHGKPVFAGAAEAISDEQRAVWEAQELAADRELARRRREGSAKKQRALDDALAPLLRIAAELRTYQDKDAFAAYVLRHIQGSWK